MLFGVLEIIGKKSAMYFSYFQGKGAAGGERKTLFCAVKVIQKTLPGETVTFDKALQLQLDV